FLSLGTKDLNAWSLFDKKFDSRSQCQEYVLSQTNDFKLAEMAVVFGCNERYNSPEKIFLPNRSLLEVTRKKESIALAIERIILENPQTFNKLYKGTLALPDGTSINVNYSRVHSIDSSRNLSDSASIEGNLYNTKFLSFGKRVFFDDFNVEVQKKWSKDFKTNFGFMKQYYLKELIELLPGTGAIRSTVITSEFIYSMTKTQTIRFELQHMSVDHRYIDNEGNELDRELDANGKTVHPKLDNNNGNWIYALAEYTVAPKWFISLFNEYNYGNEDPNRRLNYLSGNIIYVKDAMRLTLGYGRVRGGILCVGGVCRPVPASNGFSLSVSSTF
ncbi:MAG: DUF6029 family protein, partial [Bacteroidota bacterium]